MPDYAQTHDTHPVGRHEICRRDRKPRGDGRSAHRAFPLYPFESVDHGSAPKRAHALRGEREVHLDLAEALMVARLVVPLPSLWTLNKGNTLDSVPKVRRTPPSHLKLAVPDLRKIHCSSSLMNVKDIVAN